MRILAVDDDEIVLELLNEALEVNGYEDVTCVSSGRSALGVLDDSSMRFDAIFLDIQMPEMDGIELCSRIRAHPSYLTTPIIMVTAMHDKSYVNRAFAAGASDYVNKPFDVFELGLRLKTNLKLQDAYRQAQSGAPELLQDRFAFAADFDGLYERGVLEGMVSRQTLENYLAQLNRCSDEHSVVAIRIENLSELEAQLTMRDFEELLARFARALRNFFADKTALCGYVAYGTFSCIYQGPHAHLDGFFLSALAENINSGRTNRVHLKAGKVLRCRRYRDVDAAGTLAYAIESTSMTEELVHGSLTPQKRAVSTAPALNQQMQE